MLFCCSGEFVNLLSDFIICDLFCSYGSNGGTHTGTTATMDSAVIDELYKKVSQTCPLLMKDWLDSLKFNDGDDESGLVEESWPTTSSSPESSATFTNPSGAEAAEQNDNQSIDQSEQIDIAPCVASEPEARNTPSSLLDEKAKAKMEITSTLTNDDAWKDPNVNFLLRLISDDKNRGYCWRGRRDRDWLFTYKPHVELALAFVRHMSQNPVFADFIRSTLDVHGHHEERESVNVGHEKYQKASCWTSSSSLGKSNLCRIGEKKRGNGILHEAAKSGRCEYLEQFLSPTNVNARNNMGETALHLAAEFEYSDDVEILLNAGATIQVTLS